MPNCNLWNLRNYFIKENKNSSIYEYSFIKNTCYLSKYCSSAYGSYIHDAYKVYLICQIKTQSLQCKNTKHQCCQYLPWLTRFVTFMPGNNPYSTFNHTDNTLSSKLHINTEPIHIYTIFDTYAFVVVKTSVLWA